MAHSPSRQITPPGGAQLGGDIDIPELGGIGSHVGHSSAENFLVGIFYHLNPRSLKVKDRRPRRETSRAPPLLQSETANLAGPASCAAASDEHTQSPATTRAGRWPLTHPSYYVPCAPLTLPHSRQKMTPWPTPQPHPTSPSTLSADRAAPARSPSPRRHDDALPPAPSAPTSRRRSVAQACP